MTVTSIRVVDKCHYVISLFELISGQETMFQDAGKISLHREMQQMLNATTQHDLAYLIRSSHALRTLQRDILYQNASRAHLLLNGVEAAVGGAGFGVGRDLDLTRDSGGDQGGAVFFEAVD